MKVIKGLLLGTAAGDEEHGRRLVGYQMQLPRGENTHWKTNLTDIADKVKVLSDTLEIKITNTVNHPHPDQCNFDLVATFTCVINRKKCGVLKRFQQIPCLLVDLHLKRFTNTTNYIEAHMWNIMSKKAGTVYRWFSCRHWSENKCYTI